MKNEKSWVIKLVEDRLMFYFLMGLIGGTSIIYLCANKIGNALQHKLSKSIDYSLAMKMVVDNTKPAALISYVSVEAFIFFIFAFLCLYLCRNKKIYYRSFNKKIDVRENFLKIVTSINILLLTISVFAHAAGHMILFLAIWQIGAFFLYLIKKPYVKIMKWLAYALLIFIVSQFVSIFVPYLGTLKISNDFLDIPEYTYIHNQYIENKQYIDKNHFLGLNTDSTRILKNSNVSLEKRKSILPYSDTLLSCQYFTKIDCRTLINQFSLGDTLSKSTDDISKSFYRKNFDELSSMLKPGSYFHHQNAMLGPLNKYTLGVSKRDVSFLYGVGNTILISKLMKSLNQYNFQTDIKTIYMFYPTYFIILGIFGWIFFRNIYCVLAVMMLYAIGIEGTGFYAIHIAPGYSPIRHFLDIFSAGVLFFYIKSDSWKKYGYLSIGFICSLFAVWCDKEFGACVFISYSVTMLINYIINNGKRLEVLIFLVSNIAFVFLLINLMQYGEGNSLGIYGFLGVFVPKTGPVVVPTIALLTIISYFTFIKIHSAATTSTQKELYFLALYFFFYAQLVCVYYIWNTETCHFNSSMLMPTTFFVLALFAISEKRSKYLKKNANFIIAGFLLATLITKYIPIISKYSKAQIAYNKIFLSHKIFHWKFKRASFVTTMSPKPFENAVSLIDKYSKGSKKIYIISKYDNILPFLSGKYSALPFQDLSTSLVSSKEIDSTANIIIRQKPRYIFVDNDINSNHFGDIAFNSSNIELMKSSFQRAIMLNDMGKVFKKIGIYYKKTQTGTVISVYEIKSHKKKPSVPRPVKNISF